MSSQTVEPGEITWELSTAAWKFVREQPPTFQEHYADIKEAFKVVVCEYINSAGRCDQKALGFSPMGGTADGGELLKVRRPVPGAGKSGGLRVYVAVCCSVKRVLVVDAVMRRDA